MKNKKYRQKSEIAYLMLQSMSSSPIIPSQMCRMVNINRETLHEYLDVFLKIGLIMKQTVPNIYNGRINEYSLTGTGRIFMAGLKDTNKRLAWLYAI